MIGEADAEPSDEVPSVWAEGKGAHVTVFFLGGTNGESDDRFKRGCVEKGDGGPGDSQ